MGPQRYRRMKKALAGLSVNRFFGPNRLLCAAALQGMDSGPSTVRAQA
jgi:hypothetical protein